MRDNLSSTGSKLNVTVIGAGAFGTAMALMAHRAGHTVTLITQNENHAHVINTTHENPDYFKGFILPHNITATADLSILTKSDAVIIAIPSQYFEDLLDDLQAILLPSIPIFLTIKGIIFSKNEPDHPYFPWQIFQKYFKNPVALISGPNFAVELVNNLPAATSLATRDVRLTQILNHGYFRVYPTQDFVGVEVAGVVKNILALGCGMIEGASLGSNASFAFLTRGLYEMMALGKALGAEISTFLSMSGIGDLALTCSSTQSRNFTLGKRMGAGESMDAILKSNHELSEGYHSVEPLLTLAHSHNVDMPLCQAVRDVIGGTPISDAVYRLFARPTPGTVSSY